MDFTLLLHVLIILTLLSSLLRRRIQSIFPFPFPRFTTVIRGTMMLIPLLLTGLLVLSDAKSKTSSTTKKKPDMDPERLFSIPKNLWQCGSELGNFDSSFMAIHTISSGCPDHAGQFNHCCAVHDDCYSNQRGRNTCDEQFCECTKNVIFEDPAARGCYMFASLSCVGVQQLGAASYKASKDSKRPYPALPRRQRKVPNIRIIAMEYADLYEQCPNQNVTLASCALNHNICRHGENKCALDLMKCLENMKRDRNDPELCGEGIDNVIKEMTNPDHKDSKTSFTIENGFIEIVDQTAYLKKAGPDSSVFIFLVIASLGLLVCLVAAFAFTRINNRVVFDDIAPASEVTTVGESSKKSSAEDSKKSDFR